MAQLPDLSREMESTRVLIRFLLRMSILVILLLRQFRICPAQLAQHQLPLQAARLGGDDRSMDDPQRAPDLTEQRRERVQPFGQAPSRELGV